MSRKDVILSTAGIPIDLGAFLKDSAELQEVNFQPTGPHFTSPQLPIKLIN